MCSSLNLTTHFIYHPSSLCIHRQTSFSTLHTALFHNQTLPHRHSHPFHIAKLPSFVPLSTANDSSPSPSSTPPIDSVPEKPAIIVAGFLIEELPVLRHLLDSVEGHEICMIPTTPELLMKPINHVIIGSQEPAWDQPMPSTWTNGGGWGQKRVILFHDLCEADQSAILQIINDNGVKDISPYSLDKSFYLLKLGEVLALAVKANQAMHQISEELFFSEELPPVEEVLGFSAEEFSRMPAPSNSDDNLDLFLLDEIAKQGNNIDDE